MYFRPFLFGREGMGSQREYNNCKQVRGQNICIWKAINSFGHWFRFNDNFYFLAYLHFEPDPLAARTSIAAIKTKLYICIHYNTP